MENPGLPNSLWNILNGGVWHATCSTTLSSIIETGHIHASKENRYRNSFCRSLSAISIFDFGPTAVNIEGQFENWYGWFSGTNRKSVLLYGLKLIEIK